MKIIFPIRAILFGAMIAMQSFAQNAYENYAFTTLAGQPQFDGAGEPIGGQADGAGSDARFNGPISVAVDREGNVYVSEYLQNSIRKITPGGEVTTVAGVSDEPGWADGNGSQARFQNPFGVAVDGEGNIFVADTFNHLIRKITPTGQVSTLLGVAGDARTVNGSAAQARFNGPAKLAFDKEGNLYVSQPDAHVIRKVTPSLQDTTFAGMAGVGGFRNARGTAAQFNSPFGLGVAADGTVYVADRANQVIRKITPAGDVTTAAGGTGAVGSRDGMGTAARFNMPFGLAVDVGGNKLARGQSFLEFFDKFVKEHFGAAIEDRLAQPGNLRRRTQGVKAAQFNDSNPVARGFVAPIGEPENGSAFKVIFRTVGF